MGAFGWTSRPRCRPTGLLLGPAVLAVLLLTGCGPSGAQSAGNSTADPGVSVPAPPDVATAPASTGVPTIAPDDGGGNGGGTGNGGTGGGSANGAGGKGRGGVGGPALSLPRLPVGGAGEFTDADQTLQCATVEWDGFNGRSSLSRGVQVVVTGISLDTSLFALADGGCPDAAPDCRQFVFGADPAQTHCTVAVRTVRRQPPDASYSPLVLIGRARCGRASAPVCADFVAAVNSAPPGSISLAPATEEPASSESSSGDSSSGNSTPADSSADTSSADTSSADTSSADTGSADTSSAGSTPTGQAGAGDVGSDIATPGATG